MLQNLASLLKPAGDEGYAIACFNVFGYEDAKAVVTAAERRNASVILSINLDMREFMPLGHIAAMLIPLAESASVPVCLHLDHTYEIESVKQAIDCGFSSVMFDGSQLSIEQNIDGICEVVEYGRPHQVSVEAEVGSVPYASGRDHIKSALTQIDEALAMQAKGKPDAIAISIGNVHRIENAFVDIDFDHFELLRSALETPMVVHGTSGIKAEDVRRLAGQGIGKFNIGTCLRQRFGQSLRTALDKDPLLFDRLTLMRQVIPEVCDEADKMIAMLGQ